jgi:cold shock CspA family protein
MSLPSVTVASTSTTGCVKWFNNKAGYGFITVTDSTTNESRDVFVHHTAIQVGQSQYKYLVQGEYVELTISPVNNDKHEVQVSEVRGVKGGKLMCETRNEMRGARDEHHQQHAQQTHAQQTPAPTKQTQQTPQTPKFQRRTSSAPTSQSSRPPQLSKSDETEWMIVPRRKTTTAVPSGGKRSKPQQRQPTVELTQ